MKPRLSILIATIGRRNEKFQGLLKELLTQAEGKPVEIVAYWNNGEASIGDIRQDLLKEAEGEYVCFIDDDDGIPDYYIPEILMALGKDYVGFEVELFEKDQKMPRVFHSIKYGIWHQDDEGYYRGVTHLNPIKRKLALKGKFNKAGSGEDEWWAVKVTPHVRTENYINKIMYYYHHDADDSSFVTTSRGAKHTYERPGIEHPQFRWHPKSKVKGTM